MVVVLVDATAAVGPGDRMVLGRALAAVRRGDEPPALLVVVNKVDRAAATRCSNAWSQRRSRRSSATGTTTTVEYFPVSARAEGGRRAAGRHRRSLPRARPTSPTTWSPTPPRPQRVAELVREQLLARARDELPHAIACRVTEWEWPHIRCEIMVERDSQKGIVIGKGGEVFKAVGTAVRETLPEGAYLELLVRVEKHWQDRDEMLNRLGY